MRENQKKAIVVGGSNGLGLAIGKCLVEKGYFLEICDICEPEKGALDEQFFHYSTCDLLDLDEVGKLLFAEVETQVSGDPDKAEEISRKLYQIWRMLPEHIAGKEQRQIVVSFTGDEIEDYNKLIALVGADEAEDTIRGLIHKYIKDK